MVSREDVISALIYISRAGISRGLILGLQLRGIDLIPRKVWASTCRVPAGGRIGLLGHL